MQLKTAIVTGAAGNLGKAVANKFLKENYRVIGTVRKAKNDNIHGNFKEAALDLLNEDNCQQFVDEVVATDRRIDVAVLTAGGFTMSNLQNTSTKDILAQYQLNFETAYNIARPVFQQMLQQNSGRIFLIGSQAGLDTSKATGVVSYGLSKSLIFRLAEILNADAKDKNVITSVVVPGTIDTPQNREAMPNADFSDWILPSQLADIIYFYCTEEARVLREPVIKAYHNKQ